MRNHLINRISLNAATDDRIMLVTGDLGFSVLEVFQKKYPNRYINVGIAEQNMASISAGLAMEGNMVFIYSIGNFPTLRCIEQIRNNICYHDANVKILAVGGGFAYGTLGMTHHATEDIAIMRALPNMNVFVPCDYVSAEMIANEICCIPHPCYVRMERGGEQKIFAENIDMDIYDIQCIYKGSVIALIATGTVVNEALRVAKKLDLSVYVVLTIKPIAKKQLEYIADNYNFIITIEEHNVIGGLGSAVCESLADKKHKAVIKCMGLNDSYTSIVGHQEYLRKVYNLDSLAIEKKVKEIL